MKGTTPDIRLMTNDKVGEAERAREGGAGDEIMISRKKARCQTQYDQRRSLVIP